MTTGRNAAGDVRTLRLNNEGEVSEETFKLLVNRAGRKEDAALTDKQINIPTGFKKVAIINDGPAELRVSVDNDSTAIGSPIIFIKENETFEANLAGNSLHYSVNNHFCSFRYLLL